MLHVKDEAPGLARPGDGPAPPSLGLEHLPSRIATLATGMIYGAACDQQAVRLPLLGSALGASLRSGRRCALVTPCDPGMFLRKARLAGFRLEAPVKTGALAIFQLAADAATHLFRSGHEVFLSELEHNIRGRGAFLALDQADSLFMLSDPGASARAAQGYLEWVATHDHTILAMFAPAALAPRDYLTLRLVAENFGGFAVARPAAGGAVLEVRHWFGAEGANARESFPLCLHGSGTLKGFPQHAGHEDELPPVDSVIYMRGVIDGVTPAWRSWQEAHSIADALDAAQRSEAAILLLAFQRPADYEALRGAVATVRAIGPALRIIVRERGLRLRASQALALMRLGVSSILPSDLPDSAAKHIIESLQGTRFARPYDTDVEQIDAETIGLLRRHIGSAASFCDAAERLMAIADGFDIENCLVRLDVTGADPSNAVSLARRLGRDLVAFAGGRSVWLFMFGCPQSMAPTILKRLFAAPMPEICSNWSTEHDPDRMLRALHELRHQALVG